MITGKLYEELEMLEKESAVSKWKGKGKTFPQLLQDYKTETANPHRFTLDFSKWLPSLGRVMKPIVPGEMLCILSDTGSGKTLILQNLVTKIAAPMKTLFFEMELPDSQMMERFIAIKKMQPTHEIERIVKEGGAEDMADAMKHLTIYSESKFSIQDLEEIIDFEQPQIVIVDYIGLIRHAGKSRYEKLSDIAEELKLLASTKKVILITACQIARNKDASTGEIFLHDAKDSGSIENSAQRMIGLWREGEKGEHVKIKILKNQGLRDMILTFSLNTQSLNIF